MRRVTYLSVLERVSQMHLGKATPGREDASTINAYINKRYTTAFEFYFWPELMVVEQRQFRADWNSGVPYAAPTSVSAAEVFHVPSNKYAQSLRASTAEAPFTYSAGEWVENEDYWAECRSSYSAEDWQTAQVLAVGDQRRNPDDNRVYQCHTAHTAGVSFDATLFGILTPFIRSIDLDQADETPIGELEFSAQYDPRIERRGCNQFYQHNMLGNNLIFKGGVAVRPYLRFRTRPGSFTGANFSATASYDVDDQFYYPDLGDYYRVLEETASGQTPETHADKFARLDFPYIFREPVALAAYADIQGKTDGQQDKFPMHNTEANDLLLREIEKIERMQEQSTQLNVLTYA